MAEALETDPFCQREVRQPCGLCLKPLNDWITLPCWHSFCKVCLEGVVKTCRNEAPRDQPVREIPCPHCRTTFELDPDKQVADIPRNHFICNMVQAMAVEDREIGVPCSHSCSEGYSVARCVTCEKFLCRECLTDHNKYRGNNGHSVLTMEEWSKPANKKLRQNKMYCDEHSAMILKVYCETCDKLICRDCMDFKHVKQGHACFLVKDVAENYKEILASKNKVMEDALTEGNAFLQQLTRVTEHLDREAGDVKKKISRKKAFVDELFQQKTETFLKKVDETCKSKREIFESLIKETNAYVKKIETSFELSKRLVDQGTEEEIITSQKTMLNSANDLLTKRQKYFKVPNIPDENFDCTAEILGELEKCFGDMIYGNENKGKKRACRMTCVYL